MENIDLSKISVERDAINKVSASTARFYNIMPIKIERDSFWQGFMVLLY